MGNIFTKTYKKGELFIEKDNNYSKEVNCIDPILADDLIIVNDPIIVHALPIDKITQELLRFKNILDNNFLPKSPAFQVITNLSNLYKNIDQYLNKNNLKYLNKIDFSQLIIYNSDNIKNIFINIILNYYNNQVYWEIEILSRNECNWGLLIAPSIDYNNYLFKFKSFDQLNKAIDYFLNNHIDNVKYLKVFGELFKDDYYYQYNESYA